MTKLHRSPLALLACAVLAALAGVFSSSTKAYSLSPADVQGVYILKLSGDAWVRSRANGDTPPEASAESVRGTAFLILSAASQANDGVLHAEIRLEQRREGSVLDRITASPDFEATGVILGDRLSLIDTGHSVFVNALNLRFDRRGKRVRGGWLVAWPASSDGAAFSAGANVVVKGKRWVPRKNKPTIELPPIEPGETLKSIRGF